MVCVLQACQAKDVDAPIKRFRQSMFKKVHLEEREKRKAAKARKAGRLAFCPVRWKSVHFCTLSPRAHEATMIACWLPPVG